MMKHEAHQMCMEHMNKFVRIQMHDGALFDGIIEHVDEEHVYIASPVMDEEEGARFMPHPGFGPGFGHGFGTGFGPGFGHPFHPFVPFPRFRRFALPLAGLLALSVFPFGIY
jgi:hypothetical protein